MATNWGSGFLASAESGLSNILDAFTYDTGLSNLDTAITNWWNGTPGTPLAPLGAKTYAGAVGAGLSADASAVSSIAKTTVAAGQAAGQAVSGVTSALSSPLGPVLLIVIIIVIAVLVLKT